MHRSEFKCSNGSCPRSFFAHPAICRARRNDLGGARLLGLWRRGGLHFCRSRPGGRPGGSFRAAARASRSAATTSAWIVLAVAVGFGFSGARGWMQWPSFFEGKIQITGPGEYASHLADLRLRLAVHRRRSLGRDRRLSAGLVRQLARDTRLALGDPDRLRIWRRACWPSYLFRSFRSIFCRSMSRSKSQYQRSRTTINLAIA